MAPARPRRPIISMRPIRPIRPHSKNARATVAALALAAVICLIGFMAMATPPTTPTVDTTAVPAGTNGALVQDLNAGAHSITNAATISAANITASNATIYALALPGVSNGLTLVMGTNGLATGTNGGGGGSITIGTNVPYLYISGGVLDSSNAPNTPNGIVTQNGNGGIVINTDGPGSGPVFLLGSNVYEDSSGNLVILAQSGNVNVSGMLTSGGVNGNYFGNLTTAGGQSFTTIPSDQSYASIGLINSTTGWLGSGFLFVYAGNPTAFSMVLSGASAYFGSLTSSGAANWFVVSGSAFSFYIPVVSTHLNTLDDGSGDMADYGTLSFVTGTAYSETLLGMDGTSPTNPATPVAWEHRTISGVDYWAPLYQ